LRTEILTQPGPGHCRRFLPAVQRRKSVRRRRAHALSPRGAGTGRIDARQRFSPKFSRGASPTWPLTSTTSTKNTGVPGP